MTNPYYVRTFNPIVGQIAKSASLKAEFASIETGFNLIGGGIAGDGTDPGYGGMWPDITPATTIVRLRDRLFVGDGAAATGNYSGTQGGKVPTNTQGASWISRDSAFFAFAPTGLIAGAGFSRSSDQTGVPTECIGWAGAVINDKSGGSAWGLYSDVQHESGASFSAGLEVAAKNKGSNITGTPYGLGAGVIGVWLAAGGDNTYGGSAANPSNAGIVFKKNAHTWNTGILFEKTSLTGADGTTGTATAIHMGKGHGVVWSGAGGTALTIRSDSSLGANDIFLIGNASLFTVAGVGEQAILDFVHNSSAVNSLRVSNATTGNLPLIRAQGSDTNIGMQFRVVGTQAFRFQSQNSGSNDEFRVGGVNSAPVNYLHAYGSNSGSGIGVLAAGGTDTNIDIRFTPKGTGVLSFGTHTGTADTAISGYITIKDSGGTTRKLAVIT